MADTKPQAKITLHWLEVSRSHRILWLLEELQIPYELKTYKRGKDMLADPKLKEVHPLGKSPVITVETPGAEKPLVIAESAAIVEYLCDYYGKWLVPKRYREGKEDQIGGESESWTRYRFFMHYAEGSIMPLMLMALIVASKAYQHVSSVFCAYHCLDIKNSPVPFFIKPITNAIANKINTLFLEPNFKNHYQFLENQLATSPDGGEYLCGREITGADILMEFPLVAGAERSGRTKEAYPKLSAYVEKLHERDAYKRAVQKIVDTEGSFKTKL